jgi:hypothetical protein
MSGGERVNFLMMVPDEAEIHTPTVDAVEAPPIAELEFVCQARVPGGGVCGATTRSASNRNNCVRGASTSVRSALAWSAKRWKCRSAARIDWKAPSLTSETEDHDAGE